MCVEEVARPTQGSLSHGHGSSVRRAARRLEGQGPPGSCRKGTEGCKGGEIATQPQPLPIVGPLRPPGVKGPGGHRVLMKDQSPVLDIMGALSTAPSGALITPQRPSCTNLPLHTLYPPPPWGYCRYEINPTLRIVPGSRPAAHHLPVY